MPRATKNWLKQQTHRQRSHSLYLLYLFLSIVTDGSVKIKMYRSWGDKYSSSRCHVVKWVKRRSTKIYSRGRRYQTIWNSSSLRDDDVTMIQTINIIKGKPIKVDGDKIKRPRERQERKVLNYVLLAKINDRLKRRNVKGALLVNSQRELFSAELTDMDSIRYVREVGTKRVMQNLAVAKKYIEIVSEVVYDVLLEAVKRSPSNRLSIYIGDSTTLRKKKEKKNAVYLTRYHFFSGIFDHLYLKESLFRQQYGQPFFFTIPEDSEIYDENVILPFAINSKAMKVYPTE